MMMRSSCKLEYYDDEVFGKEDDSFSFLNYTSLSSHQCELTNPFFKFEDDEFLSPANYNCFLPSASNILALPDLEPISIVSHEDLLSGYGSINSWTKGDSMFGEHKRKCSDLVKKAETKTTNKRRCRRECASSCSILPTLSKETLRLYFYTPITQAAKELNMGITILKKKCRELGIKRWPHRKLTSILNIINEIKHDLENTEGEENKDKLRKELEKLEKERKMIEEFPNLEFDAKTMRLRQAYFKANHKRKRRCAMSMTITSSSSASSSSDLSDNRCLMVREDDHDDEEVKYLLYGFSHVGVISL